ncbi:hypothetical protein I8G32_03584 [Rhodopseudomonas palustris]|nr:hypothetical protein I8G32_03584 [Rhodopseudomonas palustris]
MFCVPRESLASRANDSHVIPAQAGIQYPRASMITTKALRYWFARLRGR